MKKDFFEEDRKDFLSPFGHVVLNAAQERMNKGDGTLENNIAYILEECAPMMKN
jgi:hypothetical protein